MANCLICWPNRADDASLSGGSWNVSMPLSNMLDRVIGLKSRSSDDAATSTQFEIDLSSVQAVRVLALVAHNCSISATYRIRASSTAGSFGSALYDSGTMSVWDESFTESIIEWEDDSFWDAITYSTGLLGGQATLIHLLPTATTARYWLVEITDTANPDTYIEIGRLFISNSFQPVVNMDYGIQLGYADSSVIETAWDGTEYFDKKTTIRQVQLSLSTLSDDEAWNQIFDMQRLQGITGEVLFVWDTQDLYFQRRSFLARNEALSPIEAIRYGSNAITIKLRELI